MFLGWGRIAFVYENTTQDLYDDDEILRIDERIRDDDDSLHDGGKKVRAIVNDDGFSHGDDENEESDDVRESDDGDGIRGDSHENSDLMVSNDDESGGRIGDDDDLDHRIQGKCF